MRLVPVFIFSFLVTAVSSAGHPTRRRILHQPLFPVSSQPPPSPDIATTQPSSSTTDQPFSNENQPYQTPPTPVPAGAYPSNSNNNNNNVSNHPIASQPANKPAKKIAVVISVGLVTLGMLSALAFFVYKHKNKHLDETQKLVGGGRGGDDTGQPSSFLYVGTVEPSRGVSEGTNVSPYHKLASVKASERYRPSPDLQPLPPLSKPHLVVPAVVSQPAMSSDDDDDEEEVRNGFCTPHGSNATTDMSNRNGSDSSLVIKQRSTSPVPHSKRTSPRSRLSVSSSPDTKLITTPQPPPARAPLAQTPTEYTQPLAITYGARRTKFAAPPPAPDMSRLHSVNNHSPQKPKQVSPPPPPPPPPPPAMPTPQKVGISPKKVSCTRQVEMSESRSLSSEVIPRVVKEKPLEEVNDNGVEGDDADWSKPKLKPLHWDKVRASSDRATVWDQLKSSSFQLNEDMMESLFGCNSAGLAKKEETPRSVLPPVEKERRVLDPKKSQNIAILLRALNVTRDEVSEALLDGNPEGLGAELLETLVKMAPTKEEEIKLRDYKGDMSKLGTAERFLKAILDIPFAFKRVEAMLYRANFETEIKYLRTSFKTLEEASEELKSSRLFLKLLEAVLRTGNRMNVGTNRGEATAFKLDTLLKLVDIKGTDGKTTLLHFVVQEIIRSEGTDSDTKSNSFSATPFKKQGLQVVSGLSRELSNVKKAAGMDSDVLSGYVIKLEMGLQKIRLTGHEKQDMQGNFLESMKTFIKEAEVEIAKIKMIEKKALSSVKDVTEYFHGDTAREGVQPFRIFMIVREFLGVLDHVCKEVGEMQNKTMTGTTSSFRIAATASLPVLNRFNLNHHCMSSDDESSYSTP